MNSTSFEVGVSVGDGVIDSFMQQFIINPTPITSYPSSILRNFIRLVEAGHTGSVDVYTLDQLEQAKNFAALFLENRSEQPRDVAQIDPNKYRFTYDLPQALRTPLDIQGMSGWILNRLDDIDNEEVIVNHLLAGGEIRYQIILESSATGQRISVAAANIINRQRTVFSDRENILQKFRNLMKVYVENQEKYNEEAFGVIDRVIFIIWLIPSAEGFGLGDGQGSVLDYVWPIRTYSNCLYSSVIIALDPSVRNDPRKVQKRSSKLKVSLGFGHQKLSSEKETIAVAKRKKITIEMYNHLAECTHKYNHGPKVVQLFMKGNHVMPILSKEYFKDIKLPKPPIQVPHKFISKFKSKGSKNIIAYDVEAVPDRKVKPASKWHIWNIQWSMLAQPDFAPMDLEYEEYKIMEDDVWYFSITGLDCAKKFVNHLVRNSELYDDSVFYAHNGGKFDLPLIINQGELLYNKDVKIDYAIELNSAMISLNIEIGKDKISFYDSMRLIPGSLEKMCIEMEVRYPKLKDTVDFDSEDYCLENWQKYAEQMKEYNRNDVLGLLECLWKMERQIVKSTGLSITECVTSASLAKKHYLKNYYSRTYQCRPLYMLTDEQDKNIREAYCGGRNESFWIGKIDAYPNTGECPLIDTGLGPEPLEDVNIYELEKPCQIYSKIYYYDFTSLYPDVGTKSLPYGLPTVVDVDRMKYRLANPDLSSKIGFYKVRVRTTGKCNHRPLIPIKENGRLMFRWFNKWTEIWVSTITTDLAHKLKLPYEYEPIEGYEFASDTYLSDFFGAGFKHKHKAKEKGNDVLAKAFKIIINSGYGFFGFKARERDGIEITRKESKNDLLRLKQGVLLDSVDIGNYNITRSRRDIIGVKNYNVAIAAAICDHARNKLYQLMYDIEEKGGYVFYCDTDSVMTSYCIERDPELHEKYMADDWLGYLKNEFTESVEKHYYKKYVKELASKMMVDDGTATDEAYQKQQNQKKCHSEAKKLAKKKCEGLGYYYDEAIFCGAKFYYLGRKLEDGSLIEERKLKGFKGGKPPKECFERCIRNENWYQEIKQFRCSRQNMMNYEDPFSTFLYIPEGTKTFRVNYKKGRQVGSLVQSFSDDECSSDS